MKRVGLALGSGGARGLAHLGIIRALEEAKIPIYCLSGSSMGALIGASYAIDPNINNLEAKVREILLGSSFNKMRLNFLNNPAPKDKKNFLKKTRNLIIEGYLNFVKETQVSFMSLEKLEDIISQFLPDIDIAETKLPFACVATNLNNGREQIFTKGPLRKCVMASSSIPGVFPTVNIDGHYFTDGRYVNTTPIKAAKLLKADYVIACDVKSKAMRWDKPEKATRLISRSNYITSILLHEHQLKEADIIISPRVKHIHWTGFDKINFLIKKGAQATALKIPQIKADLKKTDFLKKLKSFFSKE